MSEKFVILEKTSSIFRSHFTRVGNFKTRIIKPYCTVVQHELKTDYAEMIELPFGVDLHEWIATHALSLFHNVDHHYGVISELCTADSCPTMKGPQNTTFLWVDERSKKIKCSAPQYIG